VGHKMAGMCWHVSSLQSAQVTLEVVLHYLRRQINQRITSTKNLTTLVPNNSNLINLSIYTDVGQLRFSPKVT
jgi:hypothetical protein